MWHLKLQEANAQLESKNRFLSQIKESVCTVYSNTTSLRVRINETELYFFLDFYKHI